MSQTTSKVVVDQDTCIGCNTCPLIDPETFALDETSYKAYVKKQPTATTETVSQAISSCPVGAISLVPDDQA